MPGTIIYTSLFGSKHVAHERPVSRRSPLHDAASEGLAHVCRVLLDAKADVNAKDGRRDSCIRLFENVLLILRLISRSVPLHWSACNGHVDACKVLLDAKADVNATDKKFDGLLCYF